MFWEPNPVLGREQIPRPVKQTDNLLSVQLPIQVTDKLSPGLSKPGTSFSRVLSPDLFTGGEDVDTQLKPTEASQDASVSVAEASNVHLPCASAEARTPIISQLMSMMQEMQKQINELKQKEQSASVSTPEASSYKSPSVVSPQTPQTSPTSSRSRKKVSDVFKNYKFCPSPRKEQMPKKKNCH